MAGGAVLFGTVATLLGIGFVYGNEFKLPTSIVSGILIRALVHLAYVLEFVYLPREVYETALRLSILLVPVLTWCILWGVEWYWNVSFSQRMGQ